MSGIKALSKTEIGFETTAGTAVSGSTLWRGEAKIEDIRKHVFPAEDIGYLSGVDRSYVPQLGARITLVDTPATYEQLPYLLAMGVKNVITGSADTGGSGKIYDYPFPTTAKNTVKPATIATGDDQQAERMEYAFCESFKLSGKSGEAWMMGGVLTGRQVQAHAFAGASLPSVEEMLFGKTKLYVDAATGSIGGTLKSGTLLSAEIAVNTGWHAKFTADGQLYFDHIECRMPEVTAKITFLHDATGTAEKSSAQGQTARLIRLLIEGSTLTTAGSSYSVKTAIVDFAGKWEPFEKLGEIDGNDVLSATFRARYNATAAKFCEIKVVNQLASLP